MMLKLHFLAFTSLFKVSLISIREQGTVVPHYISLLLTCLSHVNILYFIDGDICFH